MATLGAGGTRIPDTSSVGYFLHVVRDYDHYWNAEWDGHERKKTNRMVDGRPCCASNSVESTVSDLGVNCGIEASRGQGLFEQQQSRLLTSNGVKSSRRREPSLLSPRDCCPRKRDFIQRQDPPGKKCSISPNDHDELRPKPSIAVRFDYFHPLSLISPRRSESATGKFSRVVIAHKRLLHLEIRKLARRAKLISTSLNMEQLLKPSLPRSHDYGPSFARMHWTDDVNFLQLYSTTDFLVTRARELMRTRRAIYPQQQQQQRHQHHQALGRAALESSTIVARSTVDTTLQQINVQPIFAGAKVTGNSCRIIVDKSSCPSSALHWKIADATTAEAIMGETDASLNICDDSALENPRSPCLESSMEIFNSSREQCPLSSPCPSVSTLQLVSSMHSTLPSLKRTVSSNSSSVLSVLQMKKDMRQVQNLDGKENCPESVLLGEISSVPKDVCRPPAGTYDDDKCVLRSTDQTQTFNIVTMMHTQVEKSDERSEVLEGKLYSDNHDSEPSISGSSVHCSDGVSSEVILSSPSSKKLKWDPLTLLSQNTFGRKNRRHFGSNDASATLLHSTSMDYSSTTMTKTSTSSRPTDCEVHASDPTNNRKKMKKRDGISCFDKTTLLFCRKEKLTSDDWYVAKLCGDSVRTSTKDFEENVMEMVFFDSFSDILCH
jgi:hypothetical protein